jgi:hypothetical protein
VDWGHSAAASYACIVAAAAAAAAVVAGEDAGVGAAEHVAGEHEAGS